MVTKKTQKIRNPASHPNLENVPKFFWWLPLLNVAKRKLLYYKDLTYFKVYFIMTPWWGGTACLWRGRWGCPRWCTSSSRRSCSRRAPATWARDRPGRGRCGWSPVDFVIWLRALLSPNIVLICSYHVTQLDRSSRQKWAKAWTSYHEAGKEGHGKDEEAVEVGEKVPLRDQQRVEERAEKAAHLFEGK